MAQKIAPPKRTEGDGMEVTDNLTSIDNVDVVKLLTQRIKTITIKPAERIATSPANLIHLPTGKCSKPMQSSVLRNMKAKEPKFVPYEPYKAAVKPMIPIKKTKSRKISEKESAEVEERQFEGVGKEIDHANLSNCEKCLKVVEKSQNELKCLKTELKSLTDENVQLENQLKFQVQVNGELKKLLVAAMGEDMETKVHVLTEDKLHLAKALLSSAEKLSTHREQTEWLAGQCEVWRSKFLASSVMVEELAKWKAGLYQKLNEVQEIMKNVSKEHKIMMDNNIKTYSNLSVLKENFDLISRKTDTKSKTLLDLSYLNSKLSDILILQLLGREIPFSTDEFSCELTDAEKSMEELIENPHLVHLFGEADAACTAVVDAAAALTGEMYLKCHPYMQCCSQCNGEVKLV